MTLTLRSDLPIKFYLNVYNEEDLQDDHAILFNIILYVYRVIESKQKEVDYSNFKFSTKSLKYVFGDKVNDPIFKAKLIASLKKLISFEYISLNKDIMYITEKGLTNFYIVQ